MTCHPNAAAAILEHSTSTTSMQQCFVTDTAVLHRPGTGMEGINPSHEGFGEKVTSIAFHVVSEYNFNALQR